MMQESPGPQLRPIPVAAATALSAALLATLLATPLAAQQELPVEVPVIRELANFEDTYIGRPALSPDGRWIVFGKAERAEVQNLWIMPAEGGEPVRLTSGEYWDEDPAWSADGSLLVFPSNRPSRANASQFFLMRLPMDPSTGRPAAAPRQLSIEQVLVERPAVSPDGRWVAYANAERPRKIQVIPAEGGAARTLAERPRNVFNLLWSADGRDLYFTTPGEDRRHELWRVAVTSGEAVRLHTVAGRAIRPLSARQMVLRETGGGPGARRQLIEIADHAGRVARRLDIDRRAMPVQFTPDGRALIATVPEVDAPIRVVSLAGGAPRDVTGGSEYDWPIGWTADGDVIVTTTTPAGRAAVVIVGTDGREKQTLELPEEAIGGAGSTLTGQTIMYWTRDPADPGSFVLTMQRLSDGRRFELARGSRVRPGLTGRGGAYDADGPDLLFTRRRDGRLHHYAASPDGEIRLLRSLPDRGAENPLLAVHGNRMAHVERRGDELQVRVSDHADAPFRTVATIRDPGDDSRVGIAWDHEGRRLSVPFYPGPDDSRFAVAFIDVPTGTRTAEPLIVETGAAWGYEARWLPDGSGITLLVQRTGGLQMDVIFVPARAGAEPTVLTDRDEATMWGQLVSPDGRWVAYPAEMPRGSAIIRIELPETP